MCSGQICAQFVVVSHLDVPVDRRIFPIGRTHPMSMLCRIVICNGCNRNDSQNPSYPEYNALETFAANPEGSPAEPKRGEYDKQ